MDPLFSGAGEMAALMRARDWSTTPLGLPADWDRSLRTVVRIMLTSRYAMWMGWGPDLTFFYNDAYAPTLGAKHPWALGRPRDRCGPRSGRRSGPVSTRSYSAAKRPGTKGCCSFSSAKGIPKRPITRFPTARFRPTTAASAACSAWSPKRPIASWASGDWRSCATWPPGWRRPTDEEVFGAVEH